MLILVSNDDGYLSPGLEVVATALKTLAEVEVVAPERDRSGSSHSLTLDVPLRSFTAPNGFHVVNGTPADCILLGSAEILDRPPDLVVSGINHGANLGDDVLYSGTVAAAMEGRFARLPAIAISIASFLPQHLDTATTVLLTLVEKLLHQPLPAGMILNVNVPDIPFKEINGFKTTRLGRRHRSEEILRAEDLKGRQIYWVGTVGKVRDAGPGTDFDAVRNGWVSVTPLQPDLTCHELLEEVSSWLP